MAVICQMPSFLRKPKSCTTFSLLDGDPYGLLHVIVGQRRVDDLVAVVLQVRRLYAARDGVPAVEEEDGGHANLLHKLSKVVGVSFLNPAIEFLNELCFVGRHQVFSDLFAKRHGD